MLALPPWPGPAWPEWPTSERPCRVVASDPMPVNQAYAQLLSLAVHEFRTPASVVGGYLRMLQRDTDQPLSERQQKMVAEAERSCARIVALIAELSEISKLDSGSTALTHQSFDLFTALEEVADSVHEAEGREVRLVVRGEAAGAPVSGDLTRLQTAFSAIFRAILRERVTPGLVAIDRRIGRTDGLRAAVVVVGDVERVQQAYEAPVTAFDEKRGGLGLALPLARRVIEAHGGHLSSPAIEKGRSIAIVGIPLSEQSA